MDIEKQFAELHKKLDKLFERLFIDNGDECLQSKINRHGAWIKRFGGFLAGLWAVVFALVLVVVAALLRKWLF